MATERIRILADEVRYVGRPLVRGGEYELPDWFTRGLIRARKARLVAGPDPVEVPSPEEAVVLLGDPLLEDLPDDLPGRPQLEAAGLSTLDAVRGLQDPTTVAGIGPATSRRIRAYLTQQNEGDSDG